MNLLQTPPQQEISHEIGFTLIETLVSVALMSLLVIAVLYPMTASFKMTQDSKLNLEATSKAQRDLEKARQIVLTNYGDGAQIESLLARDQDLRDIKCENVNLYNQVMPQAQCRQMNNPPLRRLSLERANANSSKKDIVMSIGVRQ